MSAVRADVSLSLFTALRFIFNSVVVTIIIYLVNTGLLLVYEHADTPLLCEPSALLRSRRFNVSQSQNGRDVLGLGNIFHLRDVLKV